MLRSLFGRKKKRPASTETMETIADARVGDVFTVSSASVTYEDAYFIVEKINRFEGYAGESHELLGVDGETRLWVEWSGRGSTLSIALRLEDRPMSIEGLGLTQADLERMDAEHSLDNGFEYDGTRYYYANSGESIFFEDSADEGHGSYGWEFADYDHTRFVSIVKYEGTPFEAYLSESVSQESVTVYRQ